MSIDYSNKMNDLNVKIIFFRLFFDISTGFLVEKNTSFRGLIDGLQIVNFVVKTINYEKKCNE